MKDMLCTLPNSIHPSPRSTGLSTVPVSKRQHTVPNPRIGLVWKWISGYDVVSYRYKTTHQKQRNPLNQYESRTILTPMELLDYEFTNMSIENG